MEGFEIDLADVSAALEAYREVARVEFEALCEDPKFVDEWRRSREAWSKMRNWRLDHRNGGQLQYRVTKHPLYRHRGWERRGFLPSIPEWEPQHLGLDNNPRQYRKNARKPCRKVLLLDPVL